MSRSTFRTLSVGLPLSLVIVAPASDGIPRVGDIISDFTLKTPTRRVGPPRRAVAVEGIQATGCEFVDGM